MSIAAKPRRENRTITVDFHDEATYFRLIDDGKAFVECVLAFLLALACSSTRLPVAVVGASRVTPIMRASGWVGSRSGGSSARHAEPFTVLPTSSCAIVRCDRKSPAMPCCDARWAQFGTVRRPLPYLPHGALPPRLCGWPPESGRRRGAVCRYPSMSWPMKSTVAVSALRSICLPLAVAVCSGT